MGWSLKLHPLFYLKYILFAKLIDDYRQVCLNCEKDNKKLVWIQMTLQLIPQI